MICDARRLTMTGFKSITLETIIVMFDHIRVRVQNVLVYVQSKRLFTVIYDKHQPSVFNHCLWRLINVARLGLQQVEEGLEFVHDTCAW